MKQLLIALVAWPVAATAQGQFTTPTGQARVAIVGEANLSKDASARPTNVGVDIEVGVVQGFSLSAFHSNSIANGFLADLPTYGICVRREAPCPARYLGGGLQARVDIMRGDIAFAIEGGAIYDANSGSNLLKGKIGLLFGYSHEKFHVVIAPNAAIGINKRSGNPDTLAIPLTIGISPARPFTVGLQSGAIIQSLSDVGKQWRVPVGLYAAMRAGEHAQIFVAFSLPSMLSGDDLDSGIDYRAATLGLAVSL